jgi:hypothetical protein
MDRVSLNDVIDASRPRTYLVRQGQIVVRPREGEIDEGLRDFLKSIAKRAVSKGTEAIRRALGKKKPSEAQKKAEKSGTQVPEAPEKTATPPTVSKADRADQEADKAKKRAAEKVRAAAAEAERPRTPSEKRAATVAAKRKAAMKAAIDANKVARQKRKKAAAASAELAGDKRASSIKDAGKAGKINAQLAHCILALHYKRGKDVRGSWNICRASLTKHGYLKGPYKEAGKVSDVRPTQKGVRRAMQHAFEKNPLNGGIKGSPPEKFQKFKNIFREIEPTV